jgi:hypothetical protein
LFFSLQMGRRWEREKNRMEPREDREKVKTKNQKKKTRIKLGCVSNQME